MKGQCKSKNKLWQYIICFLLAKPYVKHCSSVFAPNAELHWTSARHFRCTSTYAREMVSSLGGVYDVLVTEGVLV